MIEKRELKTTSVEKKKKVGRKRIGSAKKIKDIENKRKAVDAKRLLEASSQGKELNSKIGRPRISAVQRAKNIEEQRSKSQIKQLAEAAHDEELKKNMKIAGSERKEFRQADLRLRLGGRKIIEKLCWIVDEFSLLDEQIKDVKVSVKNPKKLRLTISKSTARGRLLKAQSDILFRKLSKLLPDVKSIEHTTLLTKPSKPENMTEEDLINILKDNVDINELAGMFPQYKELLMKDLEGLDIPELVN